MTGKRSIQRLSLMTALWLTTALADAQPRVIDGCIIKPRTTCYKANLSGADLSGENLTSAILFKVNLTGAILKGTKLITDTPDAIASGEIGGMSSARGTQ